MGIGTLYSMIDREEVS